MLPKTRRDIDDRFRRRLPDRWPGEGLSSMAHVTLLVGAVIAVQLALGLPQESVPQSAKPAASAVAPPPGPSAAPNPPGPKGDDVPQELLDTARALEAKRDWKGGVAAWQAVLAIAPTHRPALVGASRCQLRLDDYRAALALAEKAIAAAPADGEALVAQAAALMRAGDLERAREAFGRAVEKAPDSAPAHLGLGRLMIASSETDRGIAELSRAHELAPDDPEVLLRWAGTLNRRAEAAEALERWLDLTPGEDPAKRESVASTVGFYKALGETPVWVLDSRPPRGEGPLWTISKTPGALDGFVIELEAREKPREGQAGADVKSRKLRCLLDTGAAGLFLSARAAAKIETKALAVGAVYGGGGSGRHEMEHVLLPGVTIAGLSFRNVPAVVASAEVDPLARYDGILGPDALDSFRLVLDLPDRKIRFADPAAASGDGTAPPSGAGASPGPASATPPAIQLWKVEGQLLLRAGLNGGGTGLLMVDTGASRTVLSLAAADGLKGLSRTRRTGRTYGFGGTVDRVEDIGNLEVTIAGLSPRRLTALGLDLSLRSRLVETEIGGYLGLDVLREYALEFEPGLRTLILRRRER